MNKLLPVCEPTLSGNELSYVSEAVTSGWISSSGKYIDQFEQAFAQFSSVKYGVAVTNGTAALHLALLTLGVGKGDEVILPSFTMIASAFAVCYTGATPVFVDVETDSWNMDMNGLEEKITPRTKVVMPVHVFGTPCDMATLLQLQSRYGFHIVEDAAEAHGAEFRGKKVGSFSAISAFSFYANKNIATGEGGMVLTDDPILDRKARYFKNLCFPLEGGRRYEHDDIGFNYRMTNVQAAIGLAQTERAKALVQARIANHDLYVEKLSGVPGIIFQRVESHMKSVHWMNAILVDQAKFGTDRDAVMQHLREASIETRLLFRGMHTQKALIKYGCDVTGQYPITDRLAESGLYLPSASHLSESDIDRVTTAIVSLHKKPRAK